MVRHRLAGLQDAPSVLVMLIPGVRRPWRGSRPSSEAIRLSLIGRRATASLGVRAFVLLRSTSRRPFETESAAVSHGVNTLCSWP
jgi:hypothetical protein